MLRSFSDEQVLDCAYPLLKSGPLRDSRRGLAAIFVDRDGVLNRKIDDGYVTSFDGFEFNEALLSVLETHSAADLPIIVVSNQRCVSRGLISAERMTELMEQFTLALALRGVALSAWYCCPHGTEDHCACRKPAPGMILAAADDFGLELRECCLIGDSAGDIAAGAAAGVGTCISYRIDDPAGVIRVSAILRALYGD